MVKIEREIKTPSVVNFVRLVGADDCCIDIADFSEDVLREIGEEWTAKLIANAAKRRAEREKSQ